MAADIFSEVLPTKVPTSKSSGNVLVVSGSSTNSRAGSVSIGAGHSQSGIGGHVSIQSGSSSSNGGVGGNVKISSSTGTRGIHSGLTELLSADGATEAFKILNTAYEVSIVAMLSNTGNAEQCQEY